MIQTRAPPPRAPTIPWLTGCVRDTESTWRDSSKAREAKDATWLWVSSLVEGKDVGEVGEGGRIVEDLPGPGIEGFRGLVGTAQPFDHCGAVGLELGGVPRVPERRNSISSAMIALAKS